VDDVVIRPATVVDAKALASLNRQLILDEGHRNTMSIEQLETRMHGWLATEYRAIVAATGASIVGYALARDQEPGSLHLRQLFVEVERRRSGLGRRLVAEITASTPLRRLRVDVLIGNAVALSFWRSIGFVDYAITLER
jgi:ribosomal protein S18 acetylase RimI-like enzyme